MYMCIKILKDKNKIRKHAYKSKKWRIKDKKIFWAYKTFGQEYYCRYTNSEAEEHEDTKF